MYTVSKGDFSIFLEWSDLGTQKHVTQAEVEDAVRVCESVMKEYNVKIASIPVDNAAKHVAAEVVKRLEANYPGMKVVVSRDPSHCVDLLMKDLAKTPTMLKVIQKARIVRDFVKTDRVDSILGRQLLFKSSCFTLLFSLLSTHA